MEVLLIGGSNNFVNELISKLNKEGHRVYVLTGNRYHESAYKRAFEKYEFTYDCDSLNEIFDSVNPDVVIFMGAYDTNFNWFNARKEAVRYSAGLQNILMVFSLLNKGRFIYLSSQEVYQDSYAYNIEEKEPVTAKDFHTMAIAQGEELCHNYHRTLGIDMIILRLDQVYNFPTRLTEANNVCAYMCIEALKHGVISANGSNIFSLLFMPDAVEFVYLAVACGEHKELLYHVSSSMPVNEIELAEMVRENMGGDIKIEDNTSGEVYRVVLSNKTFHKEFNVRVFNRVEDVVRDMASYIKRHKERFLEEGDSGNTFFTRLSQNLKKTLKVAAPFLENIVGFIPFFMLNNRAVGSEYFANLDFLLIYVLLFAIVHGQQQATVSAVLAVIGYCFRQTYSRTGFEILLDYNTYVWIAQLFILGLSVGYIKDQLSLIRGDDDREIDYLSGQLNDIKDINTSNVRMKNILETQIVNQNDSLGKIYEITAGLDQYEPEEVLFYAAEILAKLVGSEDVAIYTIANKSYARLFSATSDKARELGNSLNYTELPDMYNVLLERRVYINKSLVDNYPVMANAIYSEDEMQLILMVWGIPWERMTLGQSNMLAVIGYLIQNAVLRANRYIEALENQRYVAGTNILDVTAFSLLVRAYIRARRKNLTQCAVLVIRVQDGQQEEAGVKLSKMLRQTDFLGKMEDGRLYALLANTDEQSANYVISRFESVGYPCRVEEELNV